MTRNVSRVDKLASREIVRDQLFLSKDASKSSVLAEIVRSSIWVHQPQSADSVQPVHRHRIVATGVSSAAWLLEVDPKVARDLLSRTVDELVIIGELDRANYGYFLPTPVRWVDIPRDDRKLLVGGVPTRALPPIIRAGIRHRHFVREGDGKELLVTQSLDSWIHRPTSELKDWFSTLLRNEKVNARPVKEPELASAEWQIYPTQQHKFQSKRWESLTPIQSIPQGVFLGRARDGFSISSWGLLWSDETGCSMTEIKPSDVDVRRVMYALDEQYEWPTKVIVRRGSTRVQLVCESELPISEQRYLTAVSQKITNPEGNFYPRIWDMPKDCECEAKKILTKLGIVSRYEVL